jgi:hypothetical protein
LVKATADAVLNMNDPFSSADVKMTTWLFSKIGDGSVVHALPTAGTAHGSIGNHNNHNDGVDEDDEQGGAEPGEDEDDAAAIAANELALQVPATLPCSEVGAFGAAVRQCTSFPKLRHQHRREALFMGNTLFQAPDDGDNEQDTVEDLVNEQLNGILHGNALDTVLDTGPVDLTNVPDEPNANALIAAAVAAAAAAAATAVEHDAPRRDLVAFCVRSAAELAHSEEQQHGFYLRDGRIEQTEYKDARNTDMCERLDAPGWAQRPKQGKGRGEGTVKPYLPQIAKIFAAEGKDKQHPSWILERIKMEVDLKDRLDHPTEQEIRNTISRCIGYRTRCAKANKEPDYHRFLVHGDVVSATAIAFAAMAADGGNPDPVIAGANPGLATAVGNVTTGGGGPKAQLHEVLELFIQTHADLKPAICLREAMLDDECRGVLADNEVLKAKFGKRVTNVRAASIRKTKDQL